MTYAQKLKDPRWQRRRLEVLSEANFKCQTCKSSVDELAVHHVNYKRNTEPWDYELGVELVCLCKSCHERLETEIIPMARRLAVRFHPETFSEILKAMRLIVFYQSADGVSYKTGRDEVLKIAKAIALVSQDNPDNPSDLVMQQLLEALK